MEDFILGAWKLFIILIIIVVLIAL